MINEKEWLDTVSDFRIGKAAMTLSEEVSTPPVEKPDLNLKAEPKSVQVAGVGSRMGNLFKKLTSKSADNITGKYAERLKKIPQMSLDEAEAVVQGYNYAKNQDRPINRDNLGTILNSVETSDDLMRLVDIAGTAQEKTTKQTFAQIEAESDVFKDLAPVLKGRQKGLLTAKQQYGLRTLMATTGERTAELANKIASGDSTPELLLEYQQTFVAFESLYKMAKGNARETARALNQQKMLAKTLGSKSIREMKAAMEIYGGNPEGAGIVASAKNMAARMQKGEGTIKALSYVLDKKLNLYTRGAVELWKNNILSGLGTHAVNLTSVAAANMWENFILRPVAYGFGKGRQVLDIGDTADRTYSAEMVYQQAGAFVGFRSSFGMFADAFMTGESKFSAAGAKAEHTGAVRTIARDITGGTKGGELFADAATISFRLLQAEDDAMRGIVFTSELYALAARNGRMQGKTGQELLAFADELIDNPTDEMYEMALKEASRKTFTEGDLKGAVGMMAKYTRAATGQIPALQFILPFVNTPANLLQYAMDTSALAAISPRLYKEVLEGGAKGDMALAKISTGTSLTLAVWQLYESGIISGEGPEDPAMRAQLEKEGWKPNAVKSPSGQWYQVKRMEPFSTSMGLVANMLDKAKYAPSDEAAKEFMAYAMLSMAESAFDSSWVSNARDFMESLGNQDKWKSFQTGFAASFVPYSGLVRSAEQLTDPVASRVSDDTLAKRSFLDMTGDRIASATPGLSQTLRPARYWDGTVRQPEQGGFSFMLSPLKTGTVGKGDIVNRELIQQNIALAEPDSVIRVGYTSFSLLDLTGGSDYLYDDYIKAVGLARREILNDVVNDSGYAELERGAGGGRAEILRRAASAAGRKGLVDFFDNTLMKELQTNPELYTRAEAGFKADPFDFIESLAEDLKDDTKQFDLKARQKFKTQREVLELPGEQSYVPRF